MKNLLCDQQMKAEKAKRMRYKKPIVKNLNLEYITQDLWDIMESCEDIRWYTDSEDGTDSLVNALAGEEDEAYEFKVAFGDLCAECEQMMSDIKDTWIPKCFDIFFVGIGAGKYSELLGYDSYEGDYYGLGGLDCFAEDEARKKLNTLTKTELIEAARQCYKVYHAYIGLRTRYDSLKAAIDILKDRNTGILQTVKEIDKLYEAASNETGNFKEYSASWKAFEKYTDTLPKEAWIA